MEENTNDTPAGDLDSILDAAIDKAFEEEEKTEITSGTDSEDVVEIKVSEEQSTDAEIQGDEPEPLAAPVDLSESAKEAFYKLPREAQEIYLEKHRALLADYTRKTQQAAAKSKIADQLEPVRLEYEAELIASGKQLPEVVESTLRWNRLFNQDPVKAYRALGQMLGIQAGVSTQGTQEQSFYDPARTALEERLAAIEARNQESENAVYQQRLESQLAGLATEKDGSGKEVRPFFKELIPAIQGNLAILAQKPEYADTSEVELVDIAYKQAYEPYKKLRNDSLQKQVEKSKAVKLASSSISSSVSRGVPSKPKIKSVDDAVDRAFEEHGL